MGRRRCSCAGCLALCGTCTNCLDKRQFGGQGTKKKACKMRKCVADQVEVAEGEVAEVEAVVEQDRAATGKFHFTPFYRLFRKNVAKMPSFTDFWT